MNFQSRCTKNIDWQLLENCMSKNPILWIPAAMNVCGMHPAWHSAAIKLCQVCLWFHTAASPDLNSWLIKSCAIFWEHLIYPWFMLCLLLFRKMMSINHNERIIQKCFVHGIILLIGAAWLVVSQFHWPYSEMHQNFITRSVWEPQ